LLEVTAPDVQAELDLRTDVKTNHVAIVERGSTRHYYKRLPFGWKHLSTSTDACPSFDHEQTPAQREQALAQTSKVEEAMKKWFAAQKPATRTIGNVEGRCPSIPTGLHSFNETVYDAAGEKWGCCVCGASVHIPNSRDPLYCPAHTDHKHDFRNGRCVCSAPVPAQASQLVHFCYDNDPRVVIEYEVKVELDTYIGGRNRQRIGTARECYLKLRIPYDIATKDNWFAVYEFILNRTNSQTGRDVFHACVTELRDDGTELEIEALVMQGP
jgi:hypothetical protein